MTPEQHYRAAEKALEQSEKAGHIDIANQHIARAHVHALLAAAAAPTMAEPLEVSPMPTTGPLEAPECESVYTLEGSAYYCVRPRGHIGLHVAPEETAETGSVVWTDPEAEH